MLACYTDRLSVRPGERFDLHATAAQGPCRLSIARVGADRREVLAVEGVVLGAHPVPPNADRDGCGWPAALEVEVGADWASGYYDIVLADAAGSEAHHFVVVKPPVGVRRSSALMVLATNTYQSYNYWGGATISGGNGRWVERTPIASSIACANGTWPLIRPVTLE